MVSVSAVASFNRFAWLMFVASLLTVTVPLTALAETREARELLTELADFPHTLEVSHSETAVVDYEIGLGAMQKHMGNWRFKQSLRVDGERVRYTWQIIDGFSAAEVAEQLVEALEEDSANTLLYSCEGRACGNGAQWANRVFGERILYGRAEYQNYRVYQLAGQPLSYLLVYTAARTADRQYLHAELVSAAQLEQG